MADSSATKALLDAIHDAVRWVLHIVFVPIVAGLKGLIAGLTYIHDEAAKL